MVETFGVWSARHPDTGWRLYAMYERTIGAATGWKWARTGIWRPGQGARFVEASVTDLKDFITVRGSVLPSWFKAIHVREEQKKAKQRVACPKCSQRTLERRNGETRITCTSCAATLSPDEYKALGRKHTTKPKEGLS
jgi:ribosomal protein S27E